jgi:tetrahydromethanopterin S-methyltransferase subunit F
MRRWVEGLTGGIAAGATLFLVGAAFHLMIPVVAPNIPPQFADSPLLYRPWSGWTGTYMLIHPFVYGFVFAAVFLGLRHWANFLPGVQGGLIYGAGVFVVGSLPVFLLAFASFQMSPEVALAWIAQSLAQYAIAGMAIGCVHDGVMLRVCTHLAAPADRMWELLMRKDSFLFVTRGLMSYSGTDLWPTRLFTEGATLTTRVRLVGLGPATPHEVHIVQVNAA